MTADGRRIWARCPSCAYETDIHELPDGHPATPGPGDLSICVRCAALAVFTPDLTLRQPTRREAERAMRHEAVRLAVQFALGAMRARSAKDN